MSPKHNRNLHGWVALACLWEATARKAGNVHPQRSFRDLNYCDFVASAVAIAPVFAQHAPSGVGKLVLRAIEATHRVARTNTNLGIVLLLAPLAVADPGLPLRDGLPAVLEKLTILDSACVYEAIRLARPGGMGEVAEQDLAVEPTRPLRDIMVIAQDRDLIARQYANGFQEVLHEGRSALLRGLQLWANLEDAIIGTHLELLAGHPDSLIERKCGPAVAGEASRRARAVLEAGWPNSAVGQRAFADFDAWLRADGNRRNPGTSADLVTACIFAALRDNHIGLPLSVPWSRV
jgi:triphosphoribosyl-dephospho-CoA synthase